MTARPLETSGITFVWIEHRFSHEKKMAGWNWVAGRKNQNPDICLRKPEATSVAHAMAFNKPQITKFFYVY
jgi:hypothetical protein